MLITLIILVIVNIVISAPSLFIFYIKKSVETTMQKKLELFKNELNKELDSRNSVMSHISAINNASFIRFQEQQFNARMELWRHFVNSSKLNRPLASLLSCLNINEIKKRSSDVTIKSSMRGIFEISLSTGNISINEQSVVLYKQKTLLNDILPLDHIRLLLTKELWEIYEIYQAIGVYLVLEATGIESYIDERLIEVAESNAIKKLSKVWPEPHKIQSLRKGLPILVYDFIEKLLLTTIQNDFSNSSVSTDHIKKIRRSQAEIDYEFQNSVSIDVKAELNRVNLPTDILNETFKKVMTEFCHENKK